MKRNKLIALITCFALTIVTTAFSTSRIEKVFSKKESAFREDSNEIVSRNSCQKSQGPSMRSFSKVFTDAAKKAVPAVVYIKAEGSQEEEQYSEQDPFGLFNDEFFNRFFGGPSRPSPQRQAPQISQGSGAIVSSDGYILTNFHVAGNAKKITVVVQDGRHQELNATYVGGDPQTDIAILKIEDENQKEFEHLDFGNSDDIEIGEWVMAVGNPFQLEASVTVGVISAKGRQNLNITELEDFIQTDAAINPGNSGGPLLDLDGRIIGVNTAIVTRSGGYMGIGFAVPSNIAKNVLKQVVDTGSVTRGYLGVSLQPIDKDLAEALGMEKTEGALVADVVEGSPAEKAGVKQGDIILKVDDVNIKTAASLSNEIKLKQPGTTVVLKILRNGKTKTIKLQLGTFDKSVKAASEYAEQLGITVEEISYDNAKKYHLRESDEGVVITGVKNGSLGASIGLRPGFIVVSLNQHKIKTVEDFNNALGSIEKGKNVLLLVRLGDTARYFSLRLK